MNEKPLSFDQLEELFNKYSDFENKNHVVYLGKVSQPPRKKGLPVKTRRNPNFRALKDENMEEHVKTARVVLDLPSPTRKAQDGTPAVSKIGVFTTNEDFVEGMRGAFADENNSPEYIMGTGHFQNYSIISNDPVPSAVINFFDDTVAKYQLDVEQEQKLYSLFSLSKGKYEDENSSFYMIPQSIIWASVVNDATKLVEQLRAEGKPVEKNKATLQGLVYMPPTYRSAFDMGGKGEDLLQFKIRVQRFIDNRGTAKDVKTDFVPKAFISEDGYDYFDIVANGSKIRQWFGEVKQGHPICVEGGIEATSMTRVIKLTFKIRQKICGLIGGDPGNAYWERLNEILTNPDSRIVRSYPIFMVRATNIITKF